MKSSEIAKIPTDSGQNIFLREVAFQLATLNETLTRLNFNQANSDALNIRVIGAPKLGPS